MKCYLLTYLNGHKTCVVVTDENFSLSDMISSCPSTDSELVQVLKLNCDDVKIF